MKRAVFEIVLALVACCELGSQAAEAEVLDSKFTFYDE